MKAVTVWSLGAMLTPSRLLRMGFTFVADFETMTRLVAEGVEKVATEVRQLSIQFNTIQFIVFNQDCRKSIHILIKLLS